MADDEEVFELGAVLEQLLELGEGGIGCEREGWDDPGLVAGLGANQRGGLHGALEGAGDDEVELQLHRVQHMSELQAVALAFLVEGAFFVEDGVDAPDAGAGVTEDK